MLEGLRQESITIDSVHFNVYHGGGGTPLLLLHGYPETSYAWRKVIPSLAGEFQLIVPDLPGYGESRIDGIDGFDFSKRNIGRLLLELIKALGQDGPVCVAGHDRGARVAYRMSLDNPDAVSALALLGLLPTGEMTKPIDYLRAQKSYHWFFLSQPFPLPERLIAENVDYYIHHTIKSWAGNYSAIGRDAEERYIAAFKNPDVLRASCEDYRAGLSSDIRHDDEDRQKGKKLSMPVLLLNPALNAEAAKRRREVWQDWAGDLHVVDIPSGHFVMEEEPETTSKALLDFFRRFE